MDLAKAWKSSESRILTAAILLLNRWHRTLENEPVCLSVSLSLQCNRLHLRICMQAHFSVLPVLQCHRFAHAMGWGVMTSQETLHADTCLTTHCSKRCFCNALSSSIFSSGHNMWKFKQRSTHTHSRNIPISSNFNECQIYISKLFWGVWGVNHA
jgi:hypothetical protein